MSVSSSRSVALHLMTLMTIACCFYYENQGKKLILVLHSSRFNLSDLRMMTWARTQNVTVDFCDLGYVDCNDQTTPVLQALITKHVLDNRRLGDVVGVVGPSCSSSAYAMAQLIKRSGVSVRHFHTSSLPAPLAAEVSGTSVGLLPPVDLLADANVALIKYANWSQVLVFYQDTDIDLKYTFTRFKTLLVSGERENNDVFISSLYHFDQTIRTHSIRVFFLMLDAGHAWDVLCSAYKLNVFSPTFQWVIVKTKMEEILSVKRNNCKKQEVHNVLSNSVFVTFESRLHGIGQQHYCSINLQQRLVYEESISALLYNLNNKSLFNKSNTICNSSAASFENFSNEIIISQAQSNGSVVRFVYSCVENSFINSMQAKLHFVPSEPIKLINVINLPLGICLMAVNSMLVLLYLIFFIVTVSHRKHPDVKSSSLPLLCVAYVGLFTFNFVTFIYFVQKTIAITSDRIYISLCHVFYLIITFGTTFVLGALAARLWRLYRIFVYYQNPGRFLTDRRLVLFVCCLSSVETIICIIWLVFDPIERDYRKLSHNNLKATITYQAECNSNGMPIILSLFIIYKITLLLVIMVLIYKLRNTIPKAYKMFQSNMLIILWYFYIFMIIICVPAHILGILLQNISLNVATFGTISIFMQGIVFLFILLSPVISIWKEKNLLHGAKT